MKGLEMINIMPAIDDRHAVPKKISMDLKCFNYFKISGNSLSKVRRS